MITDKNHIYFGTYSKSITKLATVMFNVPNKIIRITNVVVY